MLQKTAWQILDPADQSKLKDFLWTTRQVDSAHPFAEEGLWTRFEAAAQGLGIPLSAMLRAYHGEGS